MDNPQYENKFGFNKNWKGSFKPYYKWITLNTVQVWMLSKLY